MKNLLIGIVIAVVAIIGLACFLPEGEPFTVERVAGKYVSNADCGTEDLYLMTDGTFRLEFVSPKGKQLNHTGTWQISKTEDRLEFSEFIFGHMTAEECHKYAFKPVAYAWQPYIELTLTGKIYFVYEADLEKGYYKD
jgi:hypothetical protein